MWETIWNSIGWYISTIVQDYRQRVRTGMIKHYGLTFDSEKKQKKKPARTSSSNRKISTQPIIDKSETKSVIVHKVKKKDAPTYKDPMVSTKLEIIKKMKDQRLARERKKREAAERAKWVCLNWLHVISFYIRFMTSVYMLCYVMVW